MVALIVVPINATVDCCQRDSCKMIGGRLGIWGKGDCCRTDCWESSEEVIESSGCKVVNLTTCAVHLINLPPLRPFDLVRRGCLLSL
eukprot:10316983-Karenia_brevis.AAC.1